MKEKKTEAGMKKEKKNQNSAFSYQFQEGDAEADHANSILKQKRNILERTNNIKLYFCM